jgi:hypothetical protein
MFVGVARIVLQIPGARSLKDRRRVVRSFKERVRARFPVSLAEVGEVERYQVATLGLAVVGSHSAYCREVLGQVRNAAAQANGAVLADFASEITPFARGGAGIRGGIESVLDEDVDGDEDDEPADESGDFADEDGEPQARRKRP